MTQVSAPLALTSHAAETSVPAPPTVVPLPKVVEVESDDEEETEEGSLHKRKPSGALRPVSEIKKMRAAFQGKPLVNLPLLTPASEQQEKIDNLNLERSALSTLSTKVNASVTDLDPPTPPEADSEDDENLFQSVGAVFADMPPGRSSKTFATTYPAASTSVDIKPSSIDDYCKYLHQGFGMNDLELVRAAYTSQGLEAFVVD